MTADHTDPLGLSGTTVDKYEIGELIGEGGFSYVYRGQHLIWAQPVAIKFFAMLRAAKPALREKLLEGFIQEGKLMTELSSRSAAIVQARDIGRVQLADGAWVPYMVLEWLDGTPLDLVVQDEQQAGLAARSLEQTIALLEPAAEALDVAHRRGVAHRDLKPANLMVMGDARAAEVPVKVLDFGIAKVMGEHDQLQEQLKQTGQQLTAFTPHYGAPEQFSRTHGATGPWTDVYAMALIVLELFRGGAPVLEGGSLFEVGAHSCSIERRPTPFELGLDVSPEVEAVFARALAVRAEDRFAQMSDFWSALRGAVDAGRATALTEIQEPLEVVSPRPFGSGAGTPIDPRGEDAVAAATGPGSESTGVNPHGRTVASLATSIAPLDHPRRWPWAVAAALAVVAAVGASVFSRTSESDSASSRAAAASELRHDEQPAGMDESPSLESEGEPAGAEVEGPAADPEPLAAGDESPPDAGAADRAEPVPASAPRSGTGRAGKGRLPDQAGQAPATGAQDPFDSRSFGGRR